MNSKESNSYFQFRRFRLSQARAAMKLGVDSMILGSWVEVSNRKRILDLGAGTGVLSLMMAQRTNAHITAIELDEQACLDAELNFQSAPWPDRLELIQGDAVNYASSYTDALFDAIITNPPYFERSLKSTVAHRNLARHNDQLSNEQLLFCASKLLLPNGRLQLILPTERADRFLSEAAKQNWQLLRILNIQPKTHKPVNRRVMELSRVPGKFQEDSLVVYQGHYYSEEYIRLTKSFYFKDLRANLSPRS